MDAYRDAVSVVDPVPRLFRTSRSSVPWMRSNCLTAISSVPALLPLDGLGKREGCLAYSDRPGKYSRHVPGRLLDEIAGFRPVDAMGERRPCEDPVRWWDGIVRVRTPRALGPGAASYGRIGTGVVRKVIAVAALASLFPARRAASVNPVDALRAE